MPPKPCSGCTCRGQTCAKTCTTFPLGPKGFTKAIAVPREQGIFLRVDRQSFLSPLNLFPVVPELHLQNWQ